MNLCCKSWLNNSDSIESSNAHEHCLGKAKRATIALY